MQGSGALGEGMDFLHMKSRKKLTTNFTDGIHVDMNHLKKGEVK